MEGYNDYITCPDRKTSTSVKSSAVGSCLVVFTNVRSCVIGETASDVCKPVSKMRCMCTLDEW